ncbi:MAG: Asp23/Gls24 family envelope stress response protein [Caldilineales bacterium]
MDHHDTPPGEIVIAPAVLQTIVRMTALNQEGVLALAPRAATPLLRKRDKKTAPTEGIRIEVVDGVITTVDVHVVADPNAALNDLGKELQSQIARALEHMVGMQVQSVNVFIDEIGFDDSSKNRP